MEEENRMGNEPWFGEPRGEPLGIRAPFGARMPSVGRPCGLDPGGPTCGAPLRNDR